MRILDREYRFFDVAVVGGGLASMSFAIRLFDLGVRDVCILERESELGGNLRFSSQAIRDVSSSPLRAFEMVRKLGEETLRRGITVFLEADVKSVLMPRTVMASCPKRRRIVVKARCIALCTGAREVLRAEAQILGFRPSGVMSAGEAQRLIWGDGKVFLNGRFVIIGSHSPSLEIADGITACGGSMVRMIERQERPCFGKGGEGREAFERAVSHKLVLGAQNLRILGRERCEAVEYHTQEGAGQARHERVECDGVVISCGFLPETALAEGAGIALSDASGGVRTDGDFMTSAKRICALGDCRLVHDDFLEIGTEAQAAAKAIARVL